MLQNIGKHMLWPPPRTYWQGQYILPCATLYVLVFQCILLTYKEKNWHSPTYTWNTFCKGVQPKYVFLCMKTRVPFTRCVSLVSPPTRVTYFFVLCCVPIATHIDVYLYKLLGDGAESWIWNITLHIILSNVCKIMLFECRKQRTESLVKVSFKIVCSSSGP